MTATFLLALLVGACAPARVQSAGTPVADPDSIEAEIVAATTPRAPRQVTFSWRMDEAGSVVQGRGVVRYEAADRMRLDLFGPRGETYLIAALDAGEFRLPPMAARGFQLPSPALLWAALGVVSPATAGTLESASRREDQVRLVYRAPDGAALIYTVNVEPAPRLRRVERTLGSGVVESVEVRHTPDLQPSRTTYLDRAEYRELVLETESARDVPGGFPESIWRPDGTADRP